MSPFTTLAVFLAIFIANATPYSKYGRTCKDIGCRSNEVCVMAEDPCPVYQRDACGRYPTCQLSSSGGESCLTKICPSGQYCKTENGRPTCINTTPGLAFDSAGISSVNGQRIPTNEQPKVPADPPSLSRNPHVNPYAHASAPSEEDVDHHGSYPSYNSQNNNPAYPPYPISNNNAQPPYGGNNNYGYPAYPSSNNGHNNNGNNYGYPAYPSTGNNNNNNNNNHRPGVAVDRYGYPVYPPAPAPGQPDNRYHNNYPPQSNQPYNPGWGNNYHRSGYRNGASHLSGFSGPLLFGAFITSAFFSLRILRI